MSQTFATDVAVQQNYPRLFLTVADAPSLLETVHLDIARRGDRVQLGGGGLVFRKL